jgi:hypothetical protein
MPAVMSSTASAIMMPSNTLSAALPSMSSSSTNNSSTKSSDSTHYAHVQQGVFMLVAGVTAWILV